MNSKKDLLLLFGGLSSEYKVSCSSIASLLPYVDRERFNILTLGITQAKGEWFLTQATPDEIASGEWENRGDNLSAFISPSREMKGLQVVGDGKIESKNIDCIFPVMHGELCEDGALQGLFELAGIPYVGPDICASACSMDKTVTKYIVNDTGIRQADYYVALLYDYKLNNDVTLSAIEKHFNENYPLFVKPASAGSSVGVAKAKNRDDLKSSLDVAFKICNKVLIEEAIIGREVEVGVLGNDDAGASVVGEVLAANDFYDYEAKYENAASRTVIPAEISDDASARLRKAAVEIYRAMGCQGMSRVDFFLDENDEIIFNEINTLPGFTKISMYPKLWEATGLPYKDLITRLCELAMERKTHF